MDEIGKCQIFAGKNRVFIRLMDAVTVRETGTVKRISWLLRFEWSLPLDTGNSEEFD